LRDYKIGMSLPIETPYRIEPCLLDSIPIGITDLIANLTTSSERIAGRLHPSTASSLAELVRIMNCYYSNLIEGHNTKPRDIERALADDLEKERYSQIWCMVNLNRWQHSAVYIQYRSLHLKPLSHPETLPL